MCASMKGMSSSQMASCSFSKVYQVRTLFRICNCSTAGCSAGLLSCSHRFSDFSSSSSDQRRLPSLSSNAKHREVPVSVVQHLRLQEPVAGHQEEEENKTEYQNTETAAFRLLPTSLSAMKNAQDIRQQRRMLRLARLCKVLHQCQPATFIRALNGQRKWITQEDAVHIVSHFIHIRQTQLSFRMYKWMLQQHWFKFDATLATRLADSLGKDRHFSRCREIFDQIVNQGHVPCESTFYNLIIAYLAAPFQGSIKEACLIYNRMIQMGGYRPALKLHNALLGAITNNPDSTSIHDLKQAEMIFHNLVVSKQEIHRNVYTGLIRLHSYQEVVDKERIAYLRAHMQWMGVEEGLDVLVSILRVCAKEGDLEGAKNVWVNLLESGVIPSPEALVYRMEVHAKAGEPMNALEIFREMQGQAGCVSARAYHKIIEIMSRAQETEITEALVSEFKESGLEPLLPSLLEVMKMYIRLSMCDKVESVFFRCISEHRPSHAVYAVYLESLVRAGEINKAEEVYHQMQGRGGFVSDSICNILLGGYLTAGEFVKAEKLYDLMCEKKYDIQPCLQGKVDYILSLRGRITEKRIRLKLDKEKREILIGLLLGGVQIDSGEGNNHAIIFEFHECSDFNSALKKHIHAKFFESLNSISRHCDLNEVSCHFSTIKHPCFGFYADQFRPKGRPMIPKLIHKWLSDRVLAYWYMYSGTQASSGELLVKLKEVGSEDVERVVEVLKTKSLECSVEKKGRVFWISFQGENAIWFWKLVEPYIIDLREMLKVNSTFSLSSLKGYVGSQADCSTDGHASDVCENYNGCDCICFENTRVISTDLSASYILLYIY